MRVAWNVFADLMVQGGLWIGVAVAARAALDEHASDANAREPQSAEVEREPVASTPIAADPTRAGAAIAMQGSIADFDEPEESRPRNAGEIIDPASIALGSTYSGQGYSVQVTKIGSLPPVNGRTNKYYEIRITTSTSFVETFLVQPSISAAGSVPLLVAFHKYGNTQRDIVKNTSFETQAAIRGWHLLAPLSASKWHYSSIESQINTEAAIDWMFATFRNIDPTRVYGVGFSMGGGAVMNYAARHLDPSKAMFAAVLNHTGNVSLKDVYVQEPHNQFILDFWYGNGTAGSAEAWRLARSSTINFDQTTLEVETDADLARNLLHTAVWIVRSSDDIQLPHLSKQCDILDQHLRSLGMQVGPKYDYTVVPYVGHSWAMIDEVQVCDWLATHSLTLPTSGNTLADHDGRYFHFDVTQDAGGAFTPFAWSIDTVNNELTVSGTANLQRLKISLPDSGLSLIQPLSVQLSTADGLPDTIVLEQVSSAPTTVLRDSLAETNWSYDAQTSELTLVEYDGAPHVWQLHP